MGTLRRAGFVLVLGLGLFVAGSGSAQVHSSHDAEAHRLFDAAMAAYDDGRFEDALDYFETTPPSAYEAAGRDVNRGWDFPTPEARSRTMPAPRTSSSPRRESLAPSFRVRRP